MKITNPTEETIKPFMADGGEFPGLAPSETITVSDRVAEDLRRRYSFLLIKPDQPTPTKESMVIPKPKKKTETKITKSAKKPKTKTR